MATKTTPSRSSTHRNATIQWVALAIAGILAVLAAFTFFGSDGGHTGGHTGLAPTSISAN